MMIDRSPILADVSHLNPKSLNKNTEYIPSLFIVYSQLFISGNYMLKVNNRTLEQGLKYVPSQQ